jgi:hypothetical protein
MRNQCRPTEARTMKLANVLVFLLAANKVTKQKLWALGHWNNTEK